MTEHKQALDIQLQRLKNSCDSYDSNSISYLDISVVLRLLFHDSKTQTSLLTKLGLKDKLKMLDTAIPRGRLAFWCMDEGVSNLTIMQTAVYGGLVAKRIVNENGLYTFHFQPLCSSSQYSDYEQKCLRNGQLKSVKEWLQQKIYSDSNGNSLSRYELLMVVANNDGGAHVDEDSQKRDDYLQFRRPDGLDIRVNGEIKAFVNNPVPPSIRQIAQEVLVSIRSINY